MREKKKRRLNTGDNDIRVARVSRIFVTVECDAMSSIKCNAWTNLFAIRVKRTRSERERQTYWMRVFAVYAPHIN